MRCRRPTPAIRGCRWVWRRRLICSGPASCATTRPIRTGYGRDRFVLSAGHGSMLLYAVLYLTGYDLSLDDLKRFRQLGSRTPGHPEYGLTPGVETTTGPLGQGFGNGVGMAIAAKHLATRFERDGSGLFDHRIFAIASDGDMMEGISSEAASIAGHLGLGNIVYLYDDNHITIDGHTEIAFSEDVCGVLTPTDGIRRRSRTPTTCGRSRRRSRTDAPRQNRPSLIRVRSHIGYGSPNRQDTSEAHGKALGVEEVKLTKRILRMAARAGLLRARRCAGRVSPMRERGAQLEANGIASSNATRRRIRARPLNSMRWSKGDLPAGWDSGTAGLHAQGHSRNARVGIRSREGDRAESLEPVRRLGRPQRIDFHRYQGRRRLRARQLCGPQSPFRHPRARDVRDPQRDRRCTAASSRTDRASWSLPIIAGPRFGSRR